MHRVSFWSISEYTSRVAAHFKNIPEAIPHTASLKFMHTSSTIKNNG